MLRLIRKWLGLCEHVWEFNGNAWVSRRPVAVHSCIHCGQTRLRRFGEIAGTTHLHARPQ